MHTDFLDIVHNFMPTDGEVARSNMTSTYLEPVDGLLFVGKMPLSDAVALII